jgi:hypothetical protein
MGDHEQAGLVLQRSRQIDQRRERIGRRDESDAPVGAEPSQNLDPTLATT